MIAAAAASGALAVALPAHADSAADGTTAGSPGLISGDSIQLPVHIPVSVCGNTVNVLGALNPAAGATCANHDAHRGGPRHGGVRGGGAAAEHRTEGSAGVLSGDGVQLPVHLPVNASGNAVSVAGIGNAAVGNRSTNTSGHRSHHRAPRSTAPVHTPTPPRLSSVPPQVSLAHTGADATVPALAGSAVLLLGGTVLYRRFRAGATR
ncbi:chaplin [Streptomyces caeni]|uniref:Chaplin n=1 Tax=Streptomyces caeni TaxID=2307231 RepID=A0ABW4J432_9ACTN